MGEEQRRRCQTCNRNRHIKYYPTPQARVCKDCGKKRRTRNRMAQHYRETYDITYDEYRNLFHRYNGECWICGGRRKTLDVDHSHALEKQGVPIRDTIRGLLCARCNRHLLRAAQDDPVRLRRAADYLESMEAQSELRP